MNKIILFFFRTYIYFLSFIYSVGFCVWLLFYKFYTSKGDLFVIKRREKSPACLLDESWGRHGFAQLEDINLHFVESGDRSNPLMLFIHGFPEFWYSWRHQLKEFSKDYWTVAVDLRGYGDSEKPSGLNNYKMEKIIEDIRQLILFFGRERVILFGHDWGGLLVWNFMDFHIKMVDRFIIMNSPYHRNFVSSLLSNPTQFVKSWYCFFFQMPILPEIGLKIQDFRKFDLEMRSSNNSKITHEDMEAYKYTFSKSGALKHAVDYYRANCGILHFGPKVKIYPVGLMLFGEKDNYLESSFLDFAKSEISNLRTHILKGANHFVQQDEPERVNAVIRAYLNDEPFPEDLTSSKIMENALNL